MFKRMKIGLRMGLSFGVVIVLMIAMGLFSMKELASINEGTNLLVKDRYPKIVTAYGMADDVNEVARALRNSLLIDDPGETRKELERVAAQRAEITKRIEDLSTTIKSDGGKAALKSVTDTRSKYAETQNEIVRQIESGMKQEATKAVFTKLRPLQADYLKAIEGLVKFQSDLMIKAGKQAEETYNTSLTMILVQLGVSFAIAMLIVYFVSRSITRPIGSAVAINKKLAEGDLSVSLDDDRGDEIGQLFSAIKNMVDKFKQIMSDINMLSEAAVQGKLAVRADVSKHQGDCQKMVQAINDTLDSVIGPLNVSAEYVDRIGTRLNTKFLKGMGKRDSEFIIILDIDRVFSTDELTMVQDMGEESAA